MPKKSAFGGQNQFCDYKARGIALAEAKDLKGLAEQVEKLVSDDPISIQRASAVCYAASDCQPSLFYSFQERLLEVLAKNIHPAGPRFAFRVLGELDTPKNLQGEVIDFAFAYLENSETSTAVKVFAMAVIAKYLKLYPELNNELRAILARDFPTGSPGYKSRARKIMDAHDLRINDSE